MPCPAPSLLPRQPWLTPDPSGDIPAGPSRRATRSSCDSQPPLQSVCTPCDPPGHPMRFRHPDATPTSGLWLPVSERGPGLQGRPPVGLCPGSEGAPPTTPAAVPSCRSCLPPLAAAGAPRATLVQPMPSCPRYGPRGLFREGGTAWHSGLTALLTLQALPGPPMPQQVHTEGNAGVLPPGQEDPALPGSHQLPRHPQAHQAKR